MRKRIKLLLLSVFLTGFLGVVAKKQIKKVSADYATTEVHAIKLTFDGDTIWGWTNYSIWYFDAIVKEGTPAYDSHNEFNIAADNTALSQYSKVFPENVLSISFYLKGKNGDGQDEQYMPFTVTTGETLVGEPEWNGDAGAGELSEISKTDYFYLKYELEDGIATGINDDKVRLWLYRGHYGTNDAVVALNINDRLIKASGHSHARVGEGENHHEYFAYFDVLKDEITDVQIKFYKIKADLTVIWNKSSAHAYVAGDNNKLFKLPAVDEGDANLLSVGAVEGKVTNHFLAKVFEGYLTCSPSDENGYNAFPSLHSNFIPRTEVVAEGDWDSNWDVDGNLGGDTEIIDYAGVGKSHYINDRGDGETVDGWVKYVGLKTMYESNNPEVLGGRSPKTNTPINVVLIIGLLSVTALGAFYFLSKKKYI